MHVMGQIVQQNLQLELILHPMIKVTSTGKDQQEQHAQIQTTESLQLIKVDSACE